MQVGYSSCNYNKSKQQNQTGLNNRAIFNFEYINMETRAPNGKNEFTIFINKSGIGHKIRFR
jgi:hypothetical protein